MITVDMAKKGAMVFIEREIEKKLPLSKAFAFGAMAGIALSRAGNIIASAKESPVVKQLGIIDEDGGIDDEAIFPILEAQAERGTAVFDVPLVGTVSLTAEDFKKLHQYMQQAR